MKPLALALLLTLAPVGFAAQAGPAAPAGTPEPPSAGAAPAPADPKTADELVSSTLAEDIATASYYELVAWCRQLGLGDAGTRPDLQARLAAHFGVTLPAARAAQGKTIIIRSAREAAYATDERSGEKYLSLRGGVVLEVKDEAAGSLQVIEAASVTFNQTRKTVSAEGDVTYTLTRGTQTDTFTGASLAFDLDSSEAVFYDGSTTRVVNPGAAGTTGQPAIPGGSALTYTFQAATITRLANDTVIMKDGSFTTSVTPADPLYQIRTSTAWLLGPGEWAAQNALLMVGRVPVFYLPGFFLPGDDFLFNPNFGYKSREGSFVQTTTYLVGRKPAGSNAFSFLELSSAGPEGYDLERHGLFLGKIPQKSSAPPPADTLKLLLDAYSRLGFFAGVSGDFPVIGSFRSGLAVSRDVFLDQTATGLYTPYLPVAVPGFTVGDAVWNSSSLLGLTVPFRYGLDGTLKTTGDVFSMTAGFQYYSDPTFTSDFYARSEAGLIASLLPSSTSKTAPVASQSTLSWDVTGRLDFSRLVNSALVSTLGLPTIGAHMTWQSHAPNPSSLSFVQQYDPGTTFYFPSSVTVPSVTASIGGVLLRLPAALSAAPPASPAKGKTASSPAPAQAPSAAAAPDPGKGVRFELASPAGRPADVAPSARVPFRAPAAQPDLSNPRADNASSLTVSYQVQPRASLDHTFDSQTWATRESVDYAIRYRTFEAGGSSSVTGAASLLGGAADLSLVLAADALWRARFDPSVTEVASAEWQPLLRRDLQQDHFGLRSTFQATVRPLLAVSSLSSSALQYRLGVRLYQSAWDPASGTSSPVFVAPPLSWGTDSIAEHSLSSTVAFSAPWTSDSLAVTAQLPPLVPTLTGMASLGAGPVTGKLQGGFSQPPSGPMYQPFVAGLSADFGGGFTATEELQYDIATATWRRSTSSVQLGPFSGTFIAQWMLPVDGIGNPIPGGVAAVFPYTARAGYESVSDPLYFWKERVKLSLSVKTHLNLNLQQYTDNLFDFTLGVTFSIFKAFDLTFASFSTNSKTYRYFPGWAEAVGEVSVNPIIDLVNSYSFWDQDARKRSAFKIRTLSVAAVQHFPDWDISFQYQGSPQLGLDPSGRQQYLWTPTFSILAQWGAVPEMKSSIQGTATGVTLR